MAGVTLLGARSAFAAAAESFRRTGFAAVRGAVPPFVVANAKADVDEVVAAPHSNILYHVEEVDGRTAPARIERFVEIQGPLQIACETAREAAQLITGRDLRIFKDKLNFKYPGGGTFLPHQDSPAYFPYGTWHVSVLLPLTPFQRENGTLEVAPVCPQCPMEELAALEYEPVALSPGDLLVFDGLTPHRSGPNVTTSPRLGMYLTFTDVAEGDLRGDYYAAKAAGHEGLSLNQVDFTGKLVSG